MEKFEIPISDQSKMKMISSFQEALSLAEDGLSGISHFFDNGHGLAKWSYIFENQYTDLKNDELYTFQGARGSWKVVGVVDIESKYLYFFISRKNLTTRQTTIFAKNKPMYYISALSATYNKGFDDSLPPEQKLPIQTTMDLHFDNDQAKKIVSEVLSGCSIEIKSFCLVVVDIERYSLNGIEAIIVNEDLAELYTEDWSDFIVVNAPGEQIARGTDKEDEQHDMPLSLKKRKGKKNA